MDYHTDAEAMVRVLVQYIPCDEKVRQEVYVNLGHRIALNVIADIRAKEDRRQIRCDRPFDASVVWMDQRMSKDMDEANQRFVAALCNARAA